MMLLILCVTLFLSEASPEPAKSKSVNVALETVLEFDDKNVVTDVKIIDNVQNFLTKVKDVLGKSKSFRRSGGGSLKFTEFLENVMVTLKGYGDRELEQLVNAADEEMRKYHYRGCKFHELLQNKAVRKNIASVLDRVKDMNGRHIRRHMDKIITKLQEMDFNSSESNVANYINSLYQADASDKLHAFLHDLEQFKTKSKRSNADLLKIVRNGIRSIIFDHYSNLNHNVRKDLKMKVATYFLEYSPSEDKILNKTVVRFSTVFDIDKDFYRKPAYTNDSVLRSDTKTTKLMREKTTKITKTKKDNSETSSVDNELSIENIVEHKKYISLFPEEVTEVTKKKEVHRKKKYISLYPEATTKKMKHKKNKKSKKKTTQETTNTAVWKEHTHKKKIHTTRSRAHEKKPKVVKKNKRTKEILTENNASITVKGSMRKESIGKDFDKSIRLRSKHHKKKKRFHRNMGSTVIDDIADQTEISVRAYNHLGSGISIDSFENNDLHGHYKYRKSLHGPKKRSEKRKKENLRRLNLAHKKPDLKVGNTTDTSYIINKINSLEEQIKDMRHKIDIANSATKIVTKKHLSTTTASTVLTTSTKISSISSTKHTTANTISSTKHNVTKPVKTKAPDLPFWTSIATIDYTTKKTKKTTKLSTKEAPMVYDIDSASNETNEATDTDTDADTSITVTKTPTTAVTKKKHTTTEGIAPNTNGKPSLRSNDNITLIGNYTKPNMIPSDEKPSVVDRARKNAISSINMIKNVTMSPYDAEFAVNNVKYNKFIVNKENRTKVDKELSIENSTSTNTLFTKARTESSVSIDKKSNVTNDTVKAILVVPQEVQAGRRAISFYSPVNASDVLI